MRIKFLFWILFYLCYNHPLLSYFYFISLFNYHCKMVILVVYLMGFIELHSNPLQATPSYSNPLQSLQHTPTHSRSLRPTPTHSRPLRPAQSTLTHSTPLSLTAGHSIYSKLHSKHNHTLFETILGSLTHSREFLSFVYLIFNSNEWINHLNHYLEKISNNGFE